MVHRIWTSYFFTYQAQTEKNMSQDSCWPPALYLGTTYLFWPKFINAGLIQKARVFENWVLAPIYCQQSSLFWLVTVHIPSLKHIITTFYPNNINIIILHFYPNDMTVISISIPWYYHYIHFFPNYSISIPMILPSFPFLWLYQLVFIPTILLLYPPLSQWYFHYIHFSPDYITIEYHLGNLLSKKNARFGPKPRQPRLISWEHFLACGDISTGWEPRSR